MTSPKKTGGVLVEAAAALETELERYERDVASARCLEVSSEKGLLEARAALESCAATEQRLREQVHGFAIAMKDVQRRQQICIDETVAAAKRIEERIHDRAALLDRFGALGVRAREIDEPVQAVMQRKAEGAGDAELALALGEVVSRADAVLSDAEAVANDARERGWDDIAREAAALKQQLQSARNSVLEAQREMAGRAPS